MANVPPTYPTPKFLLFGHIKEVLIGSTFGSQINFVKVSDDFLEMM
jgi:hypothetical protein